MSSLILTPYEGTNRKPGYSEVAQSFNADDLEVFLPFIRNVLITVATDQEEDRIGTSLWDGHYKSLTFYAMYLHKRASDLGIATDSVRDMPALTYLISRAHDIRSPHRPKWWDDISVHHDDNEILNTYRAEGFPSAYFEKHYDVTPHHSVAVPESESPCCVCPSTCWEVHSIDEMGTEWIVCANCYRPHVEWVNSAFGGAHSVFRNGTLMNRTIPLGELFPGGGSSSSTVDEEFAGYRVQSVSRTDSGEVIEWARH